MKDRQLVFLSLLLIQQCFQQTPAPSQDQKENPNYDPQKSLVLDLDISACIDQNSNDWCDNTDIPMQRLPVRGSYTTKDLNGNLTDYNFNAQTEDNGKTHVSGPEFVGDGFFIQGYPKKYVDGQGFCQDVITIETDTTTSGIKAEVSIIYKACPDPTVPSDITDA